MLCSPSSFTAWQLNPVKPGPLRSCWWSVGVETRMSRDSHVSQVGILIMSRLISYEIRYTWNQFLVEFLENCMSRFILSPKNYSVVLRSTQRIFRFVKKLKGCKIGCKLREFLFLVRNTLQRVPKIHCLEFVQKTRGSDSSNWRKKRARNCGEVQRAGCWACWLLTKIGYCQD